MRCVVFAGILAVAVGLSGAARADGATASGVELGLRTGYAIPLGDATGGPGNAALSNQFTGVVPIWIDAGYRTPNIYVGAFFQYGIALLNSKAESGCGTSGVSCTGSDMMFGVDAHYHFMPAGPFDPYAGIGVGYELASISVSGGGGRSASAGLGGFQFVNFQVGGDYKAMPNLGIGPFVMFSLGEYGNCSYSGALGASGTCTIPQTAIHEWLTLGVRGEYDINP
jgi:hypothetical protein